MDTQPQRAPEPPRAPTTNPYRYASMGLELAAGIVGLTLAGYWVDYHFRTGPWGLIVGAGLGIVGSLYNFIRQALELMRADEAARKKSHLGRRDDPDRPA